MATLKQVEQVLELALSLVSEIEKTRPHEVKNLQIIASHIQEKLKSSLCENTNTSNNPIDVLLKKGKVELPDGRYKQLIQIHDALTLMGGVKFLSAKQNQHVTWFPIDWNGDKTAALFLGAEWTVEPLSVKANGELKGAWEDFDLNAFMEDFDFDQDEY
jgi:hypothetical protein